MARMFRCKHCGRLFKANPRIRSFQRYCRQQECQQARKNAWRRAKNSRDEGYRKKRHVSNKRWRKHHPAHRYQRKYRETHPEYVASNREKQQKRNKKRKIVDPITQIVKSDALSLERLIKPGVYALLQWNKNNDGKIVKSDSLMVQLTVLQSYTAYLAQPNP